MTNETPVAPPSAVPAAEAAIAVLTTTTDTSESTPAADAAAPAEPAPLSWSDFPGLHPDIKASLDEMGYITPTAVQKAVFIPVSEGKDLLVQSRTGTGKTTAFGLPTLNKLVPTHRAPQALILAPTRELAIQVARELTKIGAHRGIVVEPIYGGAPIGKQITNLKNGVHVVVGTPGRVLDHIGRRTLDTKSISTFVLDECDEMLSMGFLEDIERVVKELPEKKQTLLFSATMPDEVARYARRHMTAPEQISLSRDQVSVSDIHHAYYIVSGVARTRDLLKILYAEEPESAIIFCNMRDETTAVAKYLNKQGLDAEPLSSDLSQADRERVMNRMKAKNLRFLCATDVAARGIDISNLSHVINFSVPESPEVYVHRTGRTGRAGKKGTALSMVGPRELGNFRYVRLQFGIKPEERLLPKDDIFEGKLKVPLPPVGTPQPPDPIQILIRGVPGTPSDLEKQIFEKLYKTESGRRVLARLVAERLDKLSTRSKPKRPERDAEGAGGERDHGERPFGGERSFDRGERGPRPEGGEGGDRPRFRDRDDRGPRREGGEGGDRPRFRDRDDRGPRPEGGEGGDRPRFRDRDDRGPRPEGGDRPRFRDRDDRGPRPEGGEGGDRPRFRDRERFGSRDGGRDRGERTERTDTAVVAEAATPADATTATPGTEDRGDRGPRGDRGERSFDRDRGDGRQRREWRDRNDRDRGPRRDDHRNPEGTNGVTAATPATTEGDEPTVRLASVEAVSTVGTEAAPAVETETPRVDDVARAALQRADRGDRNDRNDRNDRGPRGDRGGRDRNDRNDRGGKRDAKPAEAATEGREFWETWADDKASRTPAPAPTPAPAKAAKAEAPAPNVTEDAPDVAADDAPAERGGRRGRDRGGRGAKADVKAEAKPAAKPARDERPARGAKAEKADAKADKAEAKDDKPARGKAAEKAAPAVASGEQARLFVGLGKKHGISADDLRALLADAVGADKANIGSVSLRDVHATVRVPENLADKIIAKVNGTSHKNQDVVVERARA